MIDAIEINYTIKKKCFFVFQDVTGGVKKENILVGQLPNSIPIITLLVASVFLNLLF